MEKNNFTFDEATHTYRLDGKRMTGCTTVLGMIAKPMLVGWAAKMSSEYIGKNVKKYELGIQMKTDEWEKLLEEAKTAHIRTRDKAAQKGTDVHAEIEKLIKDAVRGNGKIVPIGVKNKQVQHFIDWAVKNKVKFLASEKQVYSKEYFVAGTYDFKCEIDGKIYMSDIKTTSGIYDRTPFAQCAAYQMMEEEMSLELGEKCPRHKGIIINYSKECICGLNKSVDGRLIINLKKTGQFDEDKDVYISEHYEDDLELFMSALSIYRIMKNKFEPLKANYGK